jgi:hypothetical protein
MKHINTQNITSAIFATFLFVGIPMVFAWTAPKAIPPAQNTPAPINVGNIDQIKEASLGLNGLAVFGRGLYSRSSSYVMPTIEQKPDFLLGVNGSMGAKSYCDELGQNCFTPTSSGPNYSSVPAGAVMAFDLAACPTGWSSVTELSGRFVVGVGNSNTNGSSNITLRKQGGKAAHTLTVAEMPSHDHSLVGGGNIGNIGNGPAWTGYPNGESPAYVHTIRAGYTGGNQPHPIMPPYYALLYCKKN